jgi:DNA-binding FadR family transcriptional regulator
MVDSGSTTIAAESPAAMPEPAHGSAWITAKLRQAILEGQYAHGEKLPAERQFATVFGASRATIRSALIRLETERLVTRRLGAGTFVSYENLGGAEGVAELTSPLELIDVRLGIEPNMVQLAVLNATGRDIDRLAASIARMEKASADTESFTLWDEEFHELISEATRNPLMVWVYRQINAVRTHAQWNAMKDKVLTTARIEEYNRQHRALFEAIQTRDVEAGRHLMGARPAVAD